jgi:kynureninase
MELFDTAGMDRLVAKSKDLTAYLEFIIGEVNSKCQGKNSVTILTPSEERGCQLSLVIGKSGKAIHEEIGKHGVISDWRHPDVIRVAPVPMYNNFTDVYSFGILLLDAIQKHS